jgi:mono/diheme cytochrome c family protein
MKLASLVLATLVTVTITPALAAKSTKPSLKQGENLFKQTCASCHPGGTNSVAPKKTIYDSKKLASLVTFKSYLEAPNGHMPYYKFLVKDRQFLESLYKYVKTLKKHPIG